MNKRICGIALTVAAVLAAAGCTHCPAPSEARASAEILAGGTVDFHF